MFCCYLLIDIKPDELCVELWVICLGQINHRNRILRLPSLLFRVKADAKRMLNSRYPTRYRPRLESIVQVLMHSHHL